MNDSLPSVARRHHYPDAMHFSVLGPIIATENGRHHALGGQKSRTVPALLIARANELRVGAIEQRIEADLAMGRHREFAGRKSTLVN